MARLIYNVDDLQDTVNILQYINDFTAEAGLKDVLIDANKIIAIVKGMRADFPHNDGMEEASTFKKVAHFVCYFVSERPLSEPFPASFVGDKLAKVDNHQNALVALSIAIDALEKSTVMKTSADGGTEPFEITERISLSKHSFGDIVDALARTTPQTGYKLVTVLFEQLVYKTNPDCQYRP